MQKIKNASRYLAISLTLLGGDEGRNNLGEQAK